MKKFWIAIAACLSLSSLGDASACTGLLVGKKASTDGSVMISYAADSYSLYGELYRWPAAVWPAGAKLQIKEWDTGKPLGEIAQVRQTYAVVGNMNEHQVAITESTFGGRKELVDTTGIMDYGSLIYVALQRSKTAREAIKVMTDLVAEYGYYSSGESFSIADKNEVWIMEMIGKGTGNKGAVWVAIRIPDDCVSAHANQSRIQQIPFDDKENCIYSPDVVSFAREKGYFKGKDKDFSFAQAYCPYSFSGLRACEARVWSFFNKYNKDMAKYVELAKGDVNEMDDQFGGGSGFNPFGGQGGFSASGFDDLFNMFTGGFGFGGGSRGGRKAQQAGSDVTVNVELTFMEAVLGCKKSIKFSRVEKCKTCGGTGAKDDSCVKTCDKCNGSGQVRQTYTTVFGQQTVIGQCDKCHGTGTIVTDTCKTCGGKGVSSVSRTIDVTIPAGVEDGTVLQLSGEGNAVYRRVQVACTKRAPAPLDALSAETQRVRRV